MLNSSSEIQWTVMVSWEAVQSSSRIDGGFGAVRKNVKKVRKAHSLLGILQWLLLLPNPTSPGEIFLIRSFRLHIPYNLKTSSSQKPFCFNDKDILGKDISLGYWDNCLVVYFVKPHVQILEQSGHTVFLLYDLQPISFYFKISFTIYFWPSAK